jgi:hypothetical protein
MRYKFLDTPDPPCPKSRCRVRGLLIPNDLDSHKIRIKEHVD